MAHLKKIVKPDPPRCSICGRKCYKTSRGWQCEKHGRYRRT